MDKMTSEKKYTSACIVHTHSCHSQKESQQMIAPVSSWMESPHNKCTISMLLKLDAFNFSTIEP